MLLMYLVLLHNQSLCHSLVVQVTQIVYIHTPFLAFQVDYIYVSRKEMCKEEGKLQLGDIIIGVSMSEPHTGDATDFPWSFACLFALPMVFMYT